MSIYMLECNLTPFCPEGQVAPAMGLLPSDPVDTHQPQELSQLSVGSPGTAVMVKGAINPWEMLEMLQSGK